METTKLGTEEQERFTLRPSARSTIRFPLKNKNKVIKLPPCAQLNHTLAIWCGPLGSAPSPTPTPWSSGWAHRSRCYYGPCCTRYSHSSSCPCCRGWLRSCCRSQWSRCRPAGRLQLASQPRYKDMSIWFRPSTKMAIVTWKPSMQAWRAQIGSISVT